MSYDEKLIRVSDLGKLIDAPGTVRRRAVRAVKAQPVKDEDGRLWITRAEAKAALTRLVEQGYSRKTPAS